MDENERRRSTARQAWLGQLTPEQLAARSAKIRAGHQAHPDEGDGMAWVPDTDPEQRGQYELDHAGEVIEASPEVLEAAEALQRAVERRD